MCNKNYTIKQNKAICFVLLRTVATRLA